MIHSLEIQKCIFEFVLDGESVDKSDKKMTDEELQFNLKYDQLFLSLKSLLQTHCILTKASFAISSRTMSHSIGRKTVIA